MKKDLNIKEFNERSLAVQGMLIDFFEINDIPPDLAVLSMQGLFLKMSKDNKMSVNDLKKIFNALVEEYKKYK